MKRTVKQRVREIITREGQISNHHSIDTRLTTRLGAIVHQLRAEGMVITGAAVPGSKDYVYTYHAKPKPKVEYVDRGGVMHARLVPRSV